MRYETPNEEFKNLWQNIDFDTLKSLKLAGNSYSLQTCVWFAKNILINCKKLEILDLSNIFQDNIENKSAEKITENAKCFYSISHTLRDFTNLRELNISNNSIGGIVII